MYTISIIAQTLKAVWLHQNTDASIEHILLDSRKLLFPSTSLFFALDGPRRSGLSFIDELYQKEVTNFVVDENIPAVDLDKYTGANFLQVKDVLQALQQLTAFHRRQYQLPIIGITGSNGKTIVKEWLYQLLHDNFNIVRSPKSYNSQIGVPLSVWQINKDNTLGIFEAGISQPAEMERLEKIIEPTIGVFTNIGQAHSEGYLDIRQKINEKLKLFIHSDLLIYCADNSDVNSAISTFKNNVRQTDEFQLFTWSKKSKATLQIISVEKRDNHTILTAQDHRITEDDRIVKITIPFTNTPVCAILLLEISAMPPAIVRSIILKLVNSPALVPM